MTIKAVIERTREFRLSLADRSMDRSIDNLIEEVLKYVDQAYDIILSFAKWKMGAVDEKKESKQLGQYYVCSLILANKLTLIIAQPLQLVPPSPGPIWIVSPARNVGPLHMSPTRASFYMLHSIYSQNLPSPSPPPFTDSGNPTLPFWVSCQKTGLHGQALAIAQW